ncbi:hypothetical protein WI604_25625 [Bradyrhizobium symbiodeficiens]|uniref:hypothetical protein n=1 Tax=Bradyrhizobium symbiodeficiens TaxID=1404367 RepID=UPI0030CEE090
MDAAPEVAWTACGGLAALTRDWLSGPLIDVIDKEGATRTIRAIDGYPDIETFAGLAGVDPTNGIGGLLCARVYDQSGKSRNFTQEKPENQPGVWLIQGKIHFGFGGVLSQRSVPCQAQYFNVARVVPTNNRSSSLYAIVKPYCSNAGYRTDRGSPAIYAGTSMFSHGPANGIGAIDFATHSGPSIKAPLTIQRSIYSHILGQETAQVSLNGVVATAGPLAPTRGWGGHIGFQPGLPFPAGFSGRMQGVMMSSTPLSPAQDAGVKSALYRYASIRSALPSTAGKVNILIDGASFDQGQGGDPAGRYGTQNGGGYGWPEMLMDQLDGLDIQWNNTSCSGNRIEDCTLTYSSDGHPCFNPAAAKNILIGPNSAVGNTINRGKTGVQAYDDFLSWLATVRADNWDHIITYCFSAPAGDPEQDYTDLMIANARTNRVTVVVMPFIAPNPFDGHPGIQGYQTMAATIRPILSPLLV